MSVFDHSKLDEMNSELVSSLKFTEAEINKLLDEKYRISKLLEILENDLLKNEEKIIVGPVKMIDSLSELIDEFSRDGFSSKMVQKAVCNVRMMFFDDNDPAFKDIVCVDVDQNHSSHCIGVTFTFESLSNKDHAFSLFIPAEVEINAEAEEIFEIDCYMCLKVKVAKGEEIAFIDRCKTLSYLKMKNAVDSLIKDFNSDKDGQNLTNLR